MTLSNLDFNLNCNSDFNLNSNLDSNLDPNLNSNLNSNLDRLSSAKLFIGPICKQVLTKWTARSLPKRSSLEIPSGWTVLVSDLFGWSNYFSITDLTYKAIILLGKFLFG